MPRPFRRRPARRPSSSAWAGVPAARHRQRLVQRLLIVDSGADQRPDPEDVAADETVLARSPKRIFWPAPLHSGRRQRRESAHLPSAQPQDRQPLDGEQRAGGAQRPAQPPLLGQSISCAARMVEDRQRQEPPIEFEFTGAFRSFSSFAAPACTHLLASPRLAVRASTHFRPLPAIGGGKGP